MVMTSEERFAREPLTRAELDQLHMLDIEDSSTVPSGNYSRVISSGLYSVTLADDMTEAMIADAENILRITRGSGPFFGMAGHMLVTGPPRAGKGLFMNTLGYKGVRYFIDKHIVRDDHPGPAFSKFGYKFFNEDTLNTDIAQMNDMAVEDISLDGGAMTAKKKTRIKDASKKWADGAGKTMLHQAVALLDEYWRYMNRRRGMSPMNLSLGGITKMWGHLDLFLCGAAQRAQDLDRFTCLPYVNLDARCSWCTDREDTVQVVVYRVRYHEGKDRLIPTDRPSRIFIDGSKPREMLDGMRFYDLYQSKAAPQLSVKREERRDGGVFRE